MDSSSSQNIEWPTVMKRFFSDTIVLIGLTSIAALIGAVINLNIGMPVSFGYIAGIAQGCAAGYGARHLAWLIIESHQKRDQ